MIGAQNPVSFGKMFRVERKALGKTMIELAGDVGVRRQTIADIESGRNVGMHTVFAALAAMGKTVLIESARPDMERIRRMLDEQDHEG